MTEPYDPTKAPIGPMNGRCGVHNRKVLARRLSVVDMTQDEMRAELASKGIIMPASKTANVPAAMQPIMLIPMKQSASKKKRYKNAVTPGSNNPIAVAGEVHGETGKAYKFFDGLIAVWLPKSQCQYDDHRKTMIMPEWLAYEKKLI